MPSGECLAALFAPDILIGSIIVVKRRYRRHPASASNRLDAIGMMNVGDEWRPMSMK